MIHILETTLRVSMTASEAACFKAVLLFYRDNRNYPDELVQSGMVASFVRSALEGLEGVT